MIKEGSLDEAPLVEQLRDATGMSSDMWGEGQAGARAPGKNKHGILRTSRE